jgi:hypothetical protein
MTDEPSGLQEALKAPTDLRMGKELSPLESFFAPPHGLSKRVSSSKYRDTTSRTN